MSLTAPRIDGQCWMNSQPLTAADLEGRTVVVVFWAAGCPASQRRLQQVQDLQDRHQADDNGLIGIGVHTPQVPSDNDLRRLGHTLRRLRITMPVVHDPRGRTWRRYEPEAWPTTVVVDGRRRAVGVTAGCDRFDLVEAAVELAGHRGEMRTMGRLLRLGRSITGGGHRGPLDHGRANAALSRDRRSGGADRRQGRLRYPEGLAVLVDGDRRTHLAVADTGNDRILVGGLGGDGRALEVYSMLTGLDQPTALAWLAPGVLAVVERGPATVSTLTISTGRRRVVSDNLLQPTGLTRDSDGSLIITDAGDHRILRAVPSRDGSYHQVVPVAGSGAPGTRPGPAGQAELAQPVAVIPTSAGLVFSDVASSNLRLLRPEGEVVNITNNRLNSSGLVDGPAHRARLERPWGLCQLADGSLVVVDGGNNRLRHLHQRRLQTLGLGGLSGPTDVVSVDGQHLIVADTDNHRLIAVRPDRQDAWRLTIEHPEIIDDDLGVEAGGRPTYVSRGRATAAT